jgi:Ni/Fe-hydrogenase b-type cytochrome subunit
MTTEEGAADGATETPIIGGLSRGRLMALAAARTNGDDDPVTTAVADALQASHPDIETPTVWFRDVDPARPDRRYSLVRLRHLAQQDGSIRDVMVMRGGLADVLRASTTSRPNRSLLRKNADVVTRQGERPFAIAAAPVAPDGTVGEFVLQGFVGLRSITPHDEDAGDGDSGWVRNTVWSVSLRYQHWINVVLIFLLSCTGYYIMDPFFGPTPRPGESTGYLMGWVRLIHFTAAFAWLLLGATRAVLAFTSRDRYQRWPTFWPLKSKADVRHLGQVMAHYALIKTEAPLYLAHNPLQQLAYTAIYLVCAVQMATGFILYGLHHQGHAFWALVSMPTHWFGIAPIRLLHTMLMFGLWAFVIMHIYLAVRADSLERHGGVSSMVNGGVWLRRGSKPVDAPEVE